MGSEILILLILDQECLITVYQKTKISIEFFGRVFNALGQSAANILASDEAICWFLFSYYLGRIDRIFLTKDGKFQIVYGTPSDNQKDLPLLMKHLKFATISLPPYLYSTSQANIRYLAA
jgi:hypothetical protein